MAALRFKSGLGRLLLAESSYGEHEECGSEAPDDCQVESHLFAQVDAMRTSLGIRRTNHPALRDYKRLFCKRLPTSKYVQYSFGRQPLP